MTRVAIVGAGLAGSTCAQVLSAAGIGVTLVDKGRGPGGRCSTRRVDADDGEIRFDHGAQYFTIRNEFHQPLLRDWLASGVVAPWEAFIGTLENGVIGPEGRARNGSLARHDSGEARESAAPPKRYVGTPGMSAVVKALQQGLDVHFGCRIAALEPTGRHWRLRSVDPPHPALDGLFDAVVVTAPPLQCATLIAPVEPDLAATVHKSRLAPCWATMVQFDHPVRFAGPHTLGGAEPKPVGGLFVRDSPLSWVANQCTKPGRGPIGGAGGDHEHWVLHASPEWSAAHLEEQPGEVGGRMVEAFAKATGRALPSVRHLATHRWRYASVESAGNRAFLCSRHRLGVCGDWCVGGRVEGALTSGRGLAEHLLGQLGAFDIR